jgi:hypothetical protein
MAVPTPGATAVPSAAPAAAPPTPPPAAPTVVPIGWLVLSPRSLSPERGATFTLESAMARSRSVIRLGLPGWSWRSQASRAACLAFSHDNWLFCRAVSQPCSSSGCASSKLLAPPWRERAS